MENITCLLLTQEDILSFLLSKERHYTSLVQWGTEKYFIQIAIQRFAYLDPTVIQICYLDPTVLVLVLIQISIYPKYFI